MAASRHINGECTCPDEQENLEIKEESVVHLDNKKDEEKPEPKRIFTKIANWLEQRDPGLFSALIVSIGVIYSLSTFVIEPVKIQIEEGKKISVDYPVTKDKLNRLESDVKDLRTEQKVQYDLLRDTQFDVKLIAKKLNVK